VHPALDRDRDKIQDVLRAAFESARDFLLGLEERAVGASMGAPPPLALPREGVGAESAMELFVRRYGSGITGSAGPRYWGFVTGGSTPAALAGDWLASAFDQNALGATEPAAAHLERETIHLLRQLLGLTDAHRGAFVTGATMANFVGLSIARQWIAKRISENAAEDGLFGLSPIPVLSGAPHSTIYKALSMLGLGRRAVRLVPTLPDREAVDPRELRLALQSVGSEPPIVVANAGTVNTVDFDDLAAISDLKREFDFWLHVDGAFGGFAACSPRYQHLVEGLDRADSITVDAHKWLNVPYDSAMQFTRHRDLQVEVFQNSAAYLGAITADPDFLHLTPESSRRWRALPAWLTLVAYGADGYREIIERDCELAALLGQKIIASGELELLAPVRMNVVCFTLAGRPGAAMVRRYVEALRDGGKVFMTPTVYRGTPGVRAALSNWRTEHRDVEIAWQAMTETARAISVTED
jgi:glutamate/tyrosine decarboxylase-like PLP-dependent enzyme